MNRLKPFVRKYGLILAVAATALLLLVVYQRNKTCNLTEDAASRPVQKSQTAHTQSNENTTSSKSSQLGAQAFSDADHEKNAVAQETLEIINQQREAAGLPALVLSEQLLQCADLRASECTRAFSHTRPDGSEWWTLNPDLMFGENLAENCTEAQVLVDAWMASPPHRANILSTEYGTVALGASSASNGTWYWALEFGY